MQQVGKQPERYRFILNPYSDVRCSVCPECGQRTRQRKLPLVIFVKPKTVFTLNKTCRYCPDCDLLMAHQDEIEAFLTAYLSQTGPHTIGDNYMVVGTLDRPDWRQGASGELTASEILDKVHDFRQVLDLKKTGGWVPLSDSQPE